MTERHRREKQPERVRSALIAEAARHAVDKGLTAISLQAVAQAADVTKGGLLHHFPSKQALVEAVFEDMLSSLDEEIDRLMAAAQTARGRFTRAYIDAFFSVTRDGEASPWAALSLSCITDAGLRQIWADWMQQRLSRHQETDGHADLALLRYAADGVWLANLMQPGGLSDEELDRLQQTLTGQIQDVPT